MHMDMDIQTDHASYLCNWQVYEAMRLIEFCLYLFYHVDDGLYLDPYQAMQGYPNSPINTASDYLEAARSLSRHAYHRPDHGCNATYILIVQLQYRIVSIDRNIAISSNYLHFHFRPRMHTD